MSHPRRLVLGCTARGQHRWTTLFTWDLPGQIAVPGELVEWTPVSPGEVLELHCPRCGRDIRLGAEKGSGLVRALEQTTRAGQGRARFNLSTLPI